MYTQIIIRMSGNSINFDGKKKKKKKRKERKMTSTIKTRKYLI